MTTPNVQTTSLQQQVASSGDGVQLVASAFRRTNPSQVPVSVVTSGVITTYTANNGANSAVGGNTTAVITFAAANGGNFAVTTDMVLAVSPQAQTANVAFGGARVSAANTLELIQYNPSGSSANNTANEAYWFTAIRATGAVISLPANTLAGNQQGTPAIPTLSTVEATYNFTPYGAIATATVNANGQVVSANVVSQGVWYYEPPTVVFTPAAPSGGVSVSGGATGPSAGGGSGASAIATVANGGVTSIVITQQGSGYTAAPTISFIGGTSISPGMFAAVSRTVANVANVGIGNVRVAGANQIAVEFFNVGAANLTANTADTYFMTALGQIPVVSPIVTIAANNVAGANTQANAANNTALLVNNLNANDMVIGWTGPIGSNLSQAVGSNISAANTVSLAYGGQLVVANLSAGYTTIAVLKQQALPPLAIYQVYLSPSSVAANTAAEQVFTMPANITLPVNCTIGINKPSYTPNICIGGGRANSASTLGINFVNISNAAITPPAEWYTVAAFGSYTNGMSGNTANGGYCSQVVSITNNQQLNLLNELQSTAVSEGLILGG